MENHLSLSLWLILFSFTVIFLISYAFKSKPNSGNKTGAAAVNVPPGSFGWPIVGEAFSFMYEKHENFIRKRMKKYSSKIFKTNILGEPVVVLCGTAGHKFIATNELQLFLAWRTQPMQKLFRSSTQNHSNNSRLIPRQTETQIVRAPGFLKADALAPYVGIMDSQVQQHIQKHWVGKETIDVHRKAQLLLLTQSARFFMGLEDDARVQKLCDLMNVIMLSLDVIPLNFPGTAFYRGMKAAAVAKKEIQMLIKEKKAAMASGMEMKDILSFMTSRPDPASGKLMAVSEIAEKVLGLLSGAFNPASITISFIMKYLAEKPEVFDKVRNEQMEIASCKRAGEALNWEDIQKMKYSWNVALEVMRLQPPNQGIFREALMDFTYQGYTIPKGWKVYWTVSTTNMDPECFPAPEEFDPSRFDNGGPPPFTNIPFGSGPRTCPGRDYARLEILTFMHHIVKRFKWELLNPDFKVLKGLNPIPYEGLHVRLRNLSI
ncbi:beta-amyrin 28-monooxygenase [Ziziphus jujuba]|uniref:Beta-amyrin 28-monooxygenase n=2 Tax=Ziziphus jujuba TaxID=326968 RepID=A0A6P6GJQ8_ZIZJJ|nr:beta-amyrin 28-monooxygenase [Ziziphus jujuba]KAH7516268.1 hypothetical protein FEM48_Zijuj10G0117100 [Ziziphus jujuba var. spinosa]